MSAEPLERFISQQEALSACLPIVGSDGEDVVVVGCHAAALWGLPLPPTMAAVVRAGPVSVSRRLKAPASRRRGVDGHAIRLPDEHVVVQDGLLVTTPGRTWLDCAALMGSDHLLAMGDVLLSRRIASVKELRDLVTWARRRRGVVRARTVLEWVRPGAESPQESRLRWYVVAHGLPEPVINPEVVLMGQRVVRLDLAYLPLRIAIEFDGDWHAHTRVHDAERRSALKEAGWIVVVAHKDDLHDPRRFLATLRRAVQERSLVSLHRW